jgi:Domain of unknown function (DUF222)
LRGAAAGHVKLAPKLEQLPDVADAFAQGELSRQHAYAIADAYTMQRADALDGIAPVLVAAAKDVNPSDLRSLVKHATDAIDVAGERRARRRAHSHARRSSSSRADCSISRVLMLGQSEVLDVGRAKHHCPPSCTTR